MEDKPLVSVGIPTYNRPEGIRRTLECITQQTYENLEIIVSDNCSPNEEVKKVVEEFMLKDKRIQYFRQVENIGAGNNFKFVLKQAIGEYFMWAADDDEWDIIFVEECLNNIIGAGTAMSQYAIVYYQTQQKEEQKLPILNNHHTIKQNLDNFLDYIQPSIFYGLHLRISILEVLKDSFYDFYDCFFIIRQIINFNINIFSKKLYYAGINSIVYTPKPMRVSKKRVFEYFPFLKDTILIVIKSNKLSFYEKKYFVRKILYRIGELFIAHEIGARPQQVKMVKYLLKNILKHP